MIVFLFAVAGPAFRAAGGDAAQEFPVYRARFLSLARWSLLVALITGVFWFLEEAAAMSGRSLRGALDALILDAVWRKTLFGRTWNVRLWLALVLGALLCVASTRAVTAVRSVLES